jgi:preprotein translocase subunit YajC
MGQILASPLTMMILIIGVFYMLVMRPQQKRQRTHQQMLANLKKGDEVVTSGGLVGRVSGLTDRFITLEVAEKIRVRVLRSHIAGKLGTDIPAPAEGSN